MDEVADEVGRAGGAERPVVLGVPLLGGRFRRQRKSNTLVLLVPRDCPAAVLSGHACSVLDVLDVDETPGLR